MVTVPSTDPVASHAPSGEKATGDTSWPRWESVCSKVPVATSPYCHAVLKVKAVHHGEQPRVRGKRQLP